MNLVAKQIYGNKKNLGWNTYIGGVSAYLGTAALLATKLGISIVNITNFVVEGSDIKCRITANYSIPSNCFQDDGNITYYKDIDGKCTSILGYGFGVGSGGAVFIEAYFPNVTFVDQNGFSCGNGTTPNMNYIYIPRCTVLGASPSTYSAVFGGAYRSFISKLYVDVSLQTVNGGSPDPDLTTYPSLTGNVVYVTNFTPPNAVSNLTSGTIYNTAIQLNFTPPSSTNAIDFYEVYVDGIFKNKVTASGQYTTGLTASTNYNITIYAVDIFYNKSLVSNILNVSTTNRTAVDTDAIAYISASANTVYQDIIDDMYVTLKSNSLYTKLQAFYPFLGTTSTQQKWNGKNPLDTDVAFRLVFSGGGTHSNLGYTPNGTSGYANTYFIPSANQNVNSNGLTLVCGTNYNAVGADVVEIGAFNSTTQAFLLGVKNNNTSYGKVSRLNGTQVNSTGVNESRGIFTVSKQSATVTDLFKNGVELATGNSGGTLPNVACYIGALNLSGSTYGNSNQRIQFVAFHEGLSDAEVATFHTIISTFEILIGRKTW